MNGKFLIPLIALFTLTFSVQAQVKWSTVEEASSAQIGEKLYFIDFYTDWCGYCKKMDRETFSDPLVAKIMNRYYMPAKFNAESKKAVSWRGKKYQPGSGRSNVHHFATALLGQRMGFPTFALLKADGTLLQTIPGYYPPKDFVIILWYFASGDYQKYPFEHYSKIFDKDIRPQMEKQLKS